MIDQYKNIYPNKVIIGKKLSSSNTYSSVQTNSDVQHNRCQFLCSI